MFGRYFLQITGGKATSGGEARTHGGSGRQATSGCVVLLGGLPRTGMSCAREVPIRAAALIVRFADGGLELPARLSFRLCVRNILAGATGQINLGSKCFIENHFSSATFRSH